MTVTVFVRGEAGAVIEMDVPAEGSMARELFDSRVAKGELSILDTAAGTIERIVDGDGATTLRFVSSRTDTAVKPQRGSKRAADIVDVADELVTA